METKRLNVIGQLYYNVVSHEQINKSAWWSVKFKE